MKENGLKERKMDQGCTFSQMEIFTKDSSKTEIDKGKAATPGQIKATIKDNG